jgi:hypothetical protein
LAGTSAKTFLRKSWDFNSRSKLASKCSSRFSKTAGSLCFGCRAIHEISQFLLQQFSIFSFARPNRQHLPPKLNEEFEILTVALDCPPNLGLPKFDVGRWALGSFAILVAMPEATMDENNFFVPCKHHIRLSRQSRVVKSISKTH